MWWEGDGERVEWVGESICMQGGASTLTPTPSLHTHPLPGVLGPAIAPITASVAKVALRGSDSNHLSRILVAGAVISSQKFGRTGPRESPTLVATPTGRSAERARLRCPHLTALVRRLSSMGPSSSSGSMAAAGEGGGGRGTSMPTRARKKAATLKLKCQHICDKPAKRSLENTGVE